MGSHDRNHVNIGFWRSDLLNNLIGSQILRLHVDIAFCATCCCIVGLAVERYILICRYSDAKTLLTKSVRVTFLILSSILTASPLILKFFDDGEEALLSQVKLSTYDPLEVFAFGLAFDT